MLVLCNCCYCFLLVAQHVLLNVVKCDLKLSTIQMSILCPFPCGFLCRTCSVSYEEIVDFELCNYVNAEMLQKNVWGFILMQRTIHSFIWVSDVRVKGIHLARLFNSAC